MSARGWPAWLHWVGRLEARRPDQQNREGRCKRVDVKDRESRDMRARALECNLFVLIPDSNIMIVGADDQDPGPAAPPFTDFLRVVRDHSSHSSQFSCGSNATACCICLHAVQ
jgi:hypothetical protein